MVFCQSAARALGVRLSMRAGKHRVRGTVGRQHQADRLERFADDERHALLGGFQKKLAVNGCRKTGDDDGRHILQRKFLFTFRRFAGQLAVSATQRALRRVYADDVVGHAFTSEFFCSTFSSGEGTPQSGAFKTSKPHLRSVVTETFARHPGCPR